MIALQLSLESYFVLPLATLIDSKPLQEENALLPMDVTELPIVILFMTLQPENAEAPMFVTELGMVTLVKRVQSLNASLPMFVTELGMYTLVKPMLAENALSAIPFVPSLSVMDVSLVIPPLYLYATSPAYTTPLG
jgi:hypothetical protein